MRTRHAVGDNRRPLSARQLRVFEQRHMVALRHGNTRSHSKRDLSLDKHHQRGRLRRHDRAAQEYNRTMAHSGEPQAVEARGRGLQLRRSRAHGALGGAVQVLYRPRLPRVHAARRYTRSRARILPQNGSVCPADSRRDNALHLREPCDEIPQHVLDDKRMYRQRLS